MNDRDEIVKIFSEMFEGVNSHGIYPTSTAYAKFEFLLTRVRLEALGYSYAQACVLADRGTDIRLVSVPILISGALKNLTSDD